MAPTGAAKAVYIGRARYSATGSTDRVTVWPAVHWEVQRLSAMARRGRPGDPGFYHAATRARMTPVVASKYVCTGEARRTTGCCPPVSASDLAQPPPAGAATTGCFITGDFGDFGVSFVATGAGRHTRWGGPRLSVQDDTVQFGVSHRWFGVTPGVGTSIFFQAYVQSVVWTYVRCPGLVHRSCAAV